MTANQKQCSTIPGRHFLVLILLLIASSLPISQADAAIYYVCAAGNDAADGLTPANAWLSIRRVNQTKFAPGDAILFKRGDAWREGEALYGLSNGTAGKPIVFGAYGEGAKPLILASKDISAPVFWTQSAEHIWKTTLPINLTTLDLKRTGHITPDVANLIFNHEAAIGFKKRFLADLTTQGDFCLNLADTCLYLYSTANPATCYTNIEATGIRNCENNIEVIDGHYLTFTNLDLRYSKNNGLFLRDCSHIEIRHCDFSWIGGCYYPIQTFMQSPSPRPVRMGNGVQLWMGNSDVTVEHCNFDQIYDAAISPQGGDSRVAGKYYVIKNLRFHHNLINRCFYSFEFWGHQTNSVGDGIFFENNTCLNAGGGWSTAPRPDQGGAAHLKFYSSNMQLSNVLIRNNIFDQSVNYCLYSESERDGANADRMWAAFTLDYNCYYQSAKQSPVIRWRGGAANGGSDFSMADLQAYQARSGKERHSIFADPRLTADHRLQPDSPARAAGMDVGYAYGGAAPDLGAFESELVKTQP